MMTHRTSLRALLVVALLGACQRSNLPNMNPAPDAGVGNIFNVPPPVEIHLDPVLSPTPLSTVKVSGRTNQGIKDVIIRGGTMPIMASVLPTGGFCADVPVAKDSIVNLEVFALDGKGGLSPIVTAAAKQDAKSPPPPSPTCNGIAAGCNSREICNNGKDDDCDGLVDAKDVADCRSNCKDDALEPNDSSAQAPIVELGTHGNLVLCPGNEDWYAVRVRVHQSLSVSIRYNPTAGNVILEVNKPDGTLAVVAPEQMPAIKGVTLPDLAAGIYSFRIRGADSSVTTTYDLFTGLQ